MDDPQPSTRALLFVIAIVLCALGCREPADAKPVAASSRSATSAGPPAAEPPPSVAARAQTAVRNVDLPAQPERIDHVTIDPRPRCGPAVDEAEEVKHDAWLKAPDIQRSVFVLNAALEGFASANIGTTLDNERHAVIVVFQSDFHHWERIRQRLVGRIAPLEVVLQPSCYSRAKLAEAEQVLTQQGWHPRAKNTKMGFWLDASFSGYRVVIDDSAPEVAEALRQRLGELVRVSLGKPRRT